MNVAERPFGRRTMPWVVMGVGALAVIAFAVVASMTGILENPARREDPVTDRPATAAAPRPAQDFRRIREEEARLLREYQWIDREAGIARIPVERAMKLIIERGTLNPSPDGSAQ
jgi:hypothetical protein